MQARAPSVTCCLHRRPAPAPGFTLLELLISMAIGLFILAGLIAVLTANPRIDSPVKLDVQLVESDRVTSPLGVLPPFDNDVDGVRLEIESVRGEVQVEGVVSSVDDDTAR